VNADIPTDIQVHFVAEFNAHASPTGARGIGELGATGVAAAVANAVYDAVRIRIRDLPITPARLLSALRTSITQRQLWMRSSHHGHRPARACSGHPLRIARMSCCSPFRPIAAQAIDSMHQKRKPVRRRCGDRCRPDAFNR
jgi:hypothetical protein